MNVLVTGATGFVGAVLMKRLLQENGVTVRAAVRVPGAMPDPRIQTVHVGDLSTVADWSSALVGIDAVVHLAARVHVMNERSANPLEEFRHANVYGTEGLALAAAEHGVRRMVFVSTAKVNGESTSESAFSEADPPNPQDAYAISKWEAEEVLRSIAAKTDLEVVIVRPPLVYGPGVRANFLRLMRLVAQGVPLPLPDTKNKRSLLGVENLGDFLVRCVSHHEAANEIFLLSDGEDVSTRELAARLAQVLGRCARFMPIPVSLVCLAGKLLQKDAAVSRLLGSLVINSGKARQMLGWTPPVTLDDGLAATARWYLESSKRLA